EAVPRNEAPGICPPSNSVRNPTYKTVGAPPSFAESSLTRSAGCTNCAAVQGSHPAAGPAWALPTGAPACARMTGTQITHTKRFKLENLFPTDGPFSTNLYKNRVTS